MRQEFTRESIDFKLTLDNRDLVLNIDPSLIEQVLINLLRNSIHAVMGRTTRQILMRSYQQDNTDIIEVTDSGCGIPDKELKEIFIPFFSTKKDGSGIGLSLSKQIMSMHNGRIRVSSKVDQGTSFFLIFRK
jgi:signal transduction histidine kinase